MAGNGMKVKFGTIVGENVGGFYNGPIGAAPSFEGNRLEINGSSMPLFIERAEGETVADTLRVFNALKGASPEAIAELQEAYKGAPDDSAEQKDAVLKTSVGQEIVKQIPSGAAIGWEMVRHYLRSKNIIS